MVFMSPKAPPGPLGITTRRITRRLRAELGHQLIFVDYPKPAKPLTLTPEAVTKDLLSVADAADVDRFGWWGYSWGAVIGLQLAVASERVNLLMCGGFPPVHGPYAEMLKVSRGLHARAERLPVIRAPLPAKLRGGVQQFITYYEGLQDFDDVAAQARITCPKYCFAGTADQVHSGGQVVDIGGIITKSQAELKGHGWRVNLLPGLNHLKAMNPEAFLPDMKAWLKTVQAGL
jgi:pimeloyl-ACP methyl ester carboxylesterase